jgi:hypothetical protein
MRGILLGMAFGLAVLMAAVPAASALSASEQACVAGVTCATVSAAERGGQTSARACVGGLPCVVEAYGVGVNPPGVPGGCLFSNLGVATLFECWGN